MLFSSVWIKTYATLFLLYGTHIKIVNGLVSKCLRNFRQMSEKIMEVKIGPPQYMYIIDGRLGVPITFEILFLPRCAHNRTFTHFIEQEMMKFPLHFTLVTKCKQNQIIYASNMKRELNHLNDIDFQSLILFVFLQLMFGYWFQSKQLIRFIYNDAMGICVGSAN